MDDSDYLRFIHDLFEFNDENPATIKLQYYLNNKKHTNISDIGFPNIERKPRKLLVELLAFCLMPNHFHLLIRPRAEGAATSFARKLGVGYTNYFNQKYERVGPLFQGKFKSAAVTKDAHFIHLPYYIHCNPLHGNTSQSAITALNKYRWSSHLDYCGRKNFPSVTQREFLLEYFGGEKAYARNMKNWLIDDMADTAILHDVALDLDS